MTKKIFLILSVLFLLISISLSTYADVFKEHTFAINRFMTKDINPKEAELEIGIVTSDACLAKASDENKRVSGQVYNNLKMLLGSEDIILVNNYTVTPQYTMMIPSPYATMSSPQKKVFDKFIVSNIITIKTQNIPLLPKLIDTAMCNGATTINSLNLSNTDIESACNDAVKELTEQAYRQANTIAKSAKAKRISVKYINSSCNTLTLLSGPYGVSPKMISPQVVVGSLSDTNLNPTKMQVLATIEAHFHLIGAKSCKVK